MISKKEFIEEIEKLIDVNNDLSEGAQEYWAMMKEDKKKDNTAKTEKVAVLEMQFYFDSSQFNPGQRYTVLIADKYCGERRFDVDPEAIR